MMFQGLRAFGPKNTTVMRWAICLGLAATLSLHVARANADDEVEDDEETIRVEYVKVVVELMTDEAKRYSKKSDAEIIAASKKNIKDKMKDPNSVQFKDVKLRRTDSGIYICGLLNAKNSFGGYTGFTPFIATPLFYAETADSASGEVLVQALCR